MWGWKYTMMWVCVCVCDPAQGPLLWTWVWGHESYGSTAAVGPWHVTVTADSNSTPKQRAKFGIFLNLMENPLSYSVNDTCLKHYLAWKKCAQENGTLWVVASKKLLVRTELDKSPWLWGCACASLDLRAASEHHRAKRQAVKYDHSAVWNKWFNLLNPLSPGCS